MWRHIASPGLIGLLIGILSGAAAAAPDTAPRPTRVVSMNVCTDQLALMLAAPGQLLSVSYLARDARISSMVDAAHKVGVNHGRAEEIYLQDPDLVIAGRFSTQATVAMLVRLGVPVVVIEPARSLDDVRARILQMGEILGRTAAAKTLLAEYDAGLAALATNAADAAPGDGPRAAIYSARGWTQGDASLSGQILRAAGLRNIAGELGLDTGGRLALEQLALQAPDLLITPQPYPGHSQAEEILDHPAVTALRASAGQALMSDRDWV